MWRCPVSLVSVGVFAQVIRVHAHLALCDSNDSTEFLEPRLDNPHRGVPSSEESDPHIGLIWPWSRTGKRNLKCFIPDVILKAVCFEHHPDLLIRIIIILIRPGNIKMGQVISLQQLLFVVIEPVWWWKCAMIKKPPKKKKAWSRGGTLWHPTC